MQLAESIVHLSAVAIVQQLAIVLAAVLVKQTVRADVTTVVVPPAIQDARINVGVAVPMDVLLLVL